MSNVLKEILSGTTKSYQIIKAIRDNEIIAEYSRKSLSLADRIRELTMLRYKGIICESEFKENQITLFLSGSYIKKRGDNC